jgi:hypothetical protein
MNVSAKTAEVGAPIASPFLFVELVVELLSIFFEATLCFSLGLINMAARLQVTKIKWSWELSLVLKQHS